MKSDSASPWMQTPLADRAASRRPIVVFPTPAGPFRITTRWLTMPRLRSPTWQHGAAPWMPDGDDPDARRRARHRRAARTQAARGAVPRVGGPAAAPCRAERDRQRDLPARRRARGAHPAPRWADDARQQGARVAAAAGATRPGRHPVPGRAGPAGCGLSVALGDPHLGRRRDGPGRGDRCRPGGDRPRCDRPGAPADRSGGRAARAREPSGRTRRRDAGVAGGVRRRSGGRSRVAARAGGTGMGRPAGVAPRRPGHAQLARPRRAHHGPDRLGVHGRRRPRLRP